MRKLYLARGWSWLALLLPVVVLGGGNLFGAPTVGRNFTGDTIDQSGFIPPDTMGAVGPNHVVEIINGRYSVYNKTTGTKDQTSTLDGFWTAAGVTPTSFSFDPRIVYDPFAQRWYACAVDNGGGANNFLVAVSSSADPTAGWVGFKIDSDSDNGQWADYPTLGYNKDVVVITANMFTIGGSFHSITILVLPKTQLISGSVSQRTIFENQNANNLGFTVQPAVDMDNGGLPLPMLAEFNKGAGSLKVSSIGGTPTSPTLITSGGFVSVSAKGAPPTLDQPGAKQNIDAGDNRITGNVFLQQISGRSTPTLWAAHGVNVSGRAAIDWYEINPTSFALLQSGTISDGTMAYTYPTIAVNDNGDAVIGCSGGSTSTFVGAYAFTGTTTAGTTTFSSTPLLLQSGASDYAVTFGGSRNRWGDYSATMVDPSNATCFWCVQEFVSATDKWGIKMTEVCFDAPPPPSDQWVLDWPVPGAVWTLGNDDHFTYSGNGLTCDWGPLVSLFWFQFGIAGPPDCDDLVMRSGSAIVTGDQFRGMFVQAGSPAVVRVTGTRMANTPVGPSAAALRKSERDNSRMSRRPPKPVIGQSSLPLAP